MKLEKIDTLDLRPVSDPVLSRLEKARALIADGTHWWGRGAWSQDHGALCAIQAIMAFEGSGIGNGQEGQRVLRAASRKLYGLHPEHVNDQIGHAAVIRVYDYAIAMRRKQALVEVLPARVTVAEEDLVVAGD